MIMCLTLRRSVIIISTSSFARFARSATSPSFAYVRNPVPDSRAAATRLRPLQLLLPGDCIDPFQLLLQCWAPSLHLLQLLLAAWVRFSCMPLSIANCFPIVSTSVAAPRLRPLQLLLRPLRLLLPASCSGRFHPCPLFSNILRRVRGSQVACHYSLVPPHEHPTSVTHGQTDTRLKS